MKLLITSAFAIAATFSSVSADCKDGGCKKKGDGCKKKDEPVLCVSYNNDGKKDGGCKKKEDGCKKDGGCKKKKAE